MNNMLRPVAPVAAVRYESLIIAARAGDLEKCKELLQNGADVRAIFRDPTTRALWGALHEAAAMGYTKICQLLIASGADLTQRVDLSLPLDRAVRGGHMETFQMLLDAGASVTPDTLAEAAKRNDLEFCRFVVAKGIDVNSTPQFCEAPLCVAGQYGAVDVARFFIENGADVSVRSNGRTPLHFAVVGHSRRQIEFCRLLIEHGADTTKLCEPDDDPFAMRPEAVTPFQYAVQIGRNDLIGYFVDDCGEDIGQRTVSGKTLMQLAEHQPETIRLLRSIKSQMIIKDALGGDAQASAGTLKKKGLAL